MSVKIASNLSFNSLSFQKFFTGVSDGPTIIQTFTTTGTWTCPTGVEEVEYLIVAGGAGGGNGNGGGGGAGGLRFG